MASSPIIENSDLVSINVKSNGSNIKDTYQVLSIYIENNINEIPHCVLEISDGSPAAQDFPISDSDTFVPGAEIEVLAGYENKNTSVFKGMVIQHSLSINNNEGPVLRVVCKDKAVKMTVGRKNAYFTEMKDSDIIAKLIGNNGLSAEVTDTSTPLKEVVQYYATDWDFMIARAEANGMLVFAEEGKVHVKRPDEATDAVLTLTYGYDVLEFEGSIDAASQLKSIVSNAWNPKSQSVDTQTATPGNTDTGNLSTNTLSEVIGLDEYRLQTGGFLELNNLTNWAKAQATKSEYAKARGHIKFQGSALAKPGKLIELKGLGKRFNGNAYLSGVVHDISDGDWITTARIGISPEWHTAQVKTEAPLAAGLLPGIQGLQIGKVKQIHDDPDGEFRVLVTLPLIQSSEEGVWARLASFYATKEAGAFFYPEVDDEVVVGFLNDDPRFPIIMGSMYSSSREAPERPDEMNNLKAFVSKSKMKVSFDEEKKEIIVATPGGNTMVLSDEEQGITIKDQNNNSIKMSASGIEINSASAVSINAETSINLAANENISGSAPNGSISLDGLNVSTTATTELSASGGATVSISGGAEMTLQAAMIMIN